MSRAWPVIALAVAAVLASTGCDRRAVAPAGDLPPAYTRDKILDPKLAEVARAFTAWAGEQKVQAGAVFGRVEVLPPAPTLLPYGIGTYQKQLRLPAILITGPGWRVAGCATIARRWPPVRSRSFPGSWNRAPARPPCGRRSRSRRRRGWNCAGSTTWSRGGSSCMEKTSEPRHHRGIVKGALADLLVLRPAFALAAVWLTTAGHTASFREMNAARGWVTAEGYSLHSIYLLAITLTLLAAPRLARWSGSYPLVVAGLTMLGAGSLVNGVLPHAPPELLVLGRVLAGIGAGLVIRSAPRILPAGQEGRVAWAGIVLPAAGPVVIALAVEWSPWWSWQGGFLFEVVLALLSLALVLSIADPPDLDRDSPPGPVERLGYLPAAVVAALSVWYVMHWGQLHGWLEGPDITAAMIVGSVALSVLLWIVWPGLDPGTLREGLPRLGLIAYGGFVQYFNSLDMGVYGGLLVNFSPWMRSWLIWSLTIGSTAALALGRIVWQKRSPGFAGAALGLLVLAGGMSLSHHNTMNWPFWSLLNTVEFNWFAAPQHWQLAPPRFLMGFGSGMVLLAMTTRTSPEPLREARIRPLLQVAQFAGGTLSVGVLVTVLLAVHQLQYSYVADRGFIQAVERGDRNSRLAAHVATAGAGAAARQAEALEFRAVNYEADNLVFATIYGGFLVASLVLAVVCGVYSLLRYLSSPSSSPAERP